MKVNNITVNNIKLNETKNRKTTSVYNGDNKPMIAIGHSYCHLFAIRKPNPWAMQGNFKIPSILLASIQ